MKKNQTIFLELNEVNFEFVDAYVKRGKLPHLGAFLNTHGYAETVSEDGYAKLEPWIQWVTAHTGLTLEEHGIFRLGDVVNVEIEQIWERLAQQGFKVGAISPMNAKCRGEKWDFFVPDPWTNSKVVAPSTVRRMYRAISQVVNDNAQSKITVSSLIDLIIGISVTASPINYSRYVRYGYNSIYRSWYKPIFLDQLLADLFIKSVLSNNTDFSTLFLNAAAHIQHHYMFSSFAYEGQMRNPDWYIQPGNDPLLDVYSCYDGILARIIKIFPRARIMLATGLHQDPHEKLTFYWRLKNHREFLTKIHVPFQDVEPRMSRDFLVQCLNSASARKAEDILNAVKTDDGLSIFEVDNRGSDLFVILSYPYDVNKTTLLHVGSETFAKLIDEVAFVAIKNGQHNGIGYFADSGIDNIRLGERFPLREIPSRVLDAVRNTSSNHHVP